MLEMEDKTTTRSEQQQQRSTTRKPDKSKSTCMLFKCDNVLEMISANTSAQTHVWKQGTGRIYDISILLHANYYPADWLQ
jgi:hypothetical protein